jgi:hypothetical protein
MMRRSLGVALWGAIGLMACFLGALSALIGTGAGRSLVARAAEGALGRVFSGTIEIGDVGGTLLTGLTLSDVRLFDPDTTLVAWLPRAQLSYNPLEFAAGRVVLFELDLRQPVFNIVQHRNGRLNVEELLRLGAEGGGRDTTGGSHRPPTLILFRNVRIEDGTVNLRLRAGPTPDTSREIDRAARDGPHRIRRFDHLDARLAALRLSSPREKGIRIDITRLAVRSSDPEVELRDVMGRITVVGDSLDADLGRVRLPGSALRARGRIRWPRDTLLFDLALHADSAALADFRFVDRRFPAGAVLRGGVALRSHSGRLLEVQLDPLNLSYGGGSVAGRLTAFSAADSGLVAVRAAELDARDFDLEFARPFLDTLPFAGRLSGRTVADGPLGALQLETDWVFRDTLVPGWPVSTVRGRGEVDLSRGAGVGFRSFALEAATIDLGTVRRLVPAVELQGVLDAAGTLTGRLADAQFSGTLRHRPPPPPSSPELPASAIRGVVRLDTRTDTLGVFADVIADSLSFDGLRGSFSGLPLAGAVTGPVRLEGTLAALATHADLQSTADGGGVRVDGVLTLLPSRLALREFSLRTRDLDLSRWLASGDAPSSRLALTLGGTIAADVGAAPEGAVAAALGPSLFAGTALDTGVARVRFAGGRLHVDSLRLTQPGLITTGRGALGWARPAGGTLTLDFDADSLASLDSLLAWVVARSLAREPPRGGRSLAGAARVHVSLQGALDSLALEARASLERARWGEWRIPAGRVHVAFQPGPAPSVAAEVTLDSLGLGGRGFGAAAATVVGTRDSLAWFARSRVGEVGAFLAGGRYTRRHGPGGDAAVSVAVDSLAVLLPGDVWVLHRPAEFVVTDSAARVAGLTLESAYGKGRLVLRGDLPTGGPVDAHLEIGGFPLAGLYALLQRDTAGVGGTIAATAVLGGTRSQPRLTGSFSLTDGSIGEFRAPSLDGTFEYRDRRLESAMHLWRSGQQVLTVEARLPLDLALVPTERRQLPDSLSVRAAADRVDLSLLEALTPFFEEVGGVFTADVGIAGTWEAPRLRGGLLIQDAAATIPALNVRYEGITGRLTLSGDTIRVDTMTVQSDRGRADVSGFVRLERLTRPVLALGIVAHEFKALDLKQNVTVTASGRLALRGPVIGATLTGRATVTSGVLYFSDLVKKRIVNLDELADTALISLVQEQRLGPEFESVFLDSLRIRDLELDMGSDVWLRSTEANIQLTGTVLVKKERDQYLVSGTLQAPRGTYRLKVGPVTREFVVTEGTVKYFGTPDQDAELNIEAKHTVHPVPKPAQQNPEDVTVVAHITGTLLVPRVTLKVENKDLSQTEVISYLLFGKQTFEFGADPGGIASQQALVRTFASVLSGELERTIVSDLGVPVDYVEIRPGGQTDPLSGVQLAVGRQLGPKTFLVVDAGFCEGRAVALHSTLGLSLQFRISSEFRTEASFEPIRTCADPLVESQTGNVVRQVGFDLFWEKRY